MTRTRYHRRPTAGLAVLLAVFAPLLLDAQEVSLPLGTQAPQAALEDLDGNPVQLLDYAEEGKPTILEFWASWCEQCEALQPQFDRIQEEYGSRVSIVAVAVAVSQSQRRVKRHVEQHGIEYTYLWDARGEAVKAYNVSGTSIVVILDAEGSIVYTGVGGEQDLIGEVERLLGLRTGSLDARLTSPDADPTRIPLLPPV